MEEQNFKSIDELERFEAHLADFGIKPDGQLKERLAALRKTLERRQAAIDSSLRADEGAEQVPRHTRV